MQSNEDAPSVYYRGLGVILTGDCEMIVLKKNDSKIDRKPIFDSKITNEYARRLTFLPKLAIIREKSFSAGDNMRSFDYSKLRTKTWDTEILGYVAQIHEHKGRQELFLKRQPEDLERLV